MKKILIIFGISSIIPLFSSEKTPRYFPQASIPTGMPELIASPQPRHILYSHIVCPQPIPAAHAPAQYEYSIQQQPAYPYNSGYSPSGNDDYPEPLQVPFAANPFHAILDAYFYNATSHYAAHHEACIKHIIATIDFSTLKSLDDNSVQLLCDNLIMFADGINQNAFDMQCIYGFISWLKEAHQLPVAINSTTQIPSSNYSPTIVYTELFENSDIMKTINRSFARHLQADQLEAIQQLVNRMTTHIDDLIRNAEASKNSIPDTKTSANITTMLTYDAKLNTLNRAKNILQKDMQGYIWRAQHPYFAHFSFLPIWQKYGIAAAGACAAYFFYKWIFTKSETIPLYDPNHQYTYDRTKNENNQ